MGHADFEHQLEGGITLRFYWAPYTGNLTGVLGRLQAAAEQRATEEVWRVAEAGGAHQAAQGLEGRRRLAGAQQQGQQQRQQRRRGNAVAPAAAQQRQPAAVVLSTTLWHLLHVTAADDFTQQLGGLNLAAAEYSAAAAAAAKRLPEDISAPAGGDGSDDSTAAPSALAASLARWGVRLVLASGPELFTNRMKTEAKKAAMTAAHLDAYNAAVQGAGLLAPAGPFTLLDVAPLTRQCGEECSVDGIHSHPAVYDAALQLLLAQLAQPPPGAARRRRLVRRDRLR